MPNKLALYYHTLRYLRPVQLYGRLGFRLARPRPDLSPAPALAPSCGDWIAPAERSQSLTGPAEFVFLDQPGSLAADGWDGPGKTKLWRYNQHYFDDVNAIGAAERRALQDALIARWIVENKPGHGSGWEPYPTSLRIVNWVKMALSGHELSAEVKHSLAVQARWLTQRLEWHLLGNHLFANAKALLFAGLFFEGPQAERWRVLAKRILLVEIPEQILADGGHFELSPMYHALAYEDMLDLLNLLRARGGAAEVGLKGEIETRLADMADWLLVLSHPDGRLGFFNDTAMGTAPETETLLAYAERLGQTRPRTPLGTRALAQTGYYRLEEGDAVLLADLANVGPDYLPGHAHADTLSFELSVFGQSVIVNSGTSEYGTGAERHRQRGTAAHSTVTVAGQDSSEVWAGFRVARRARVHDVCHAGGDLAARHTGYRRLSPPTDHQRYWQLAHGTLSVTDQIDPAQSGIARYHLHPDVICVLQGPNQGVLTLPGGQVLTLECEGEPLRLETGNWHPCFGQSRPNHCLVLGLKQGRSVLRLSWSDPTLRQD